MPTVTVSMHAQSLVETLLGSIGGLVVLTVAWQQTGFDQLFISGAALGVGLMLVAWVVYDRRQAREVDL